MEKIYAVILAAGTSSRLGFDKLTVKVDGRSVISRAVEHFCIEVIDKVFIVTNPEDSHVRRELELPHAACSSPLVFIRNENYWQGMSSSVKAALPFIGDADAVFFHLGDKPFIERETVNSILQVRTEAGIIVPVYRGQKGHPVMMKVQRYIAEMKALSGDKGLREMVDKHPEDVLFIEGGEGSILDIDTIMDITFLEERGHKIEKG